jgi:hypothetical protein
VRVIELRRREHDHREDDESSGSDGPAWQYQWVVSGHWPQLTHVCAAPAPTSLGTVSTACAPCPTRPWPEPPGDACVQPQRLRLARVTG